MKLKVGMTAKLDHKNIEFYDGKNKIFKIVKIRNSLVFPDRIVIDLKKIYPVKGRGKISFYEKYVLPVSLQEDFNDEEYEEMLV